MAIDPREERLPKWAQSELARLRSNVRYYRKELEQVRGDAEPDHGRAYLQGFNQHESFKQTLDGLTVGFHGIDIEFRVERNAVLAMAKDSVVFAHPGASNTLYLFTARDMDDLASPNQEKEA